MKEKTADIDILEKLECFEPDDLVECAMYRECIEAVKTLIAENKELKEEIEELKEKDDANLAYYDQIYQNGIYTGQKAVEDKIKAKIGKRMQKNNNTIHNAKLKHGKDYVYYDDVQEAKEENRICKEILQSLLEKE